MSRIFIRITLFALVFLLVSGKIFGQNEWTGVDQLKIHPLLKDTALCSESGEYYRVMCKENKVFFKTSFEQDWDIEDTLPFIPKLSDIMGRFGRVFYMKVDDGYLVAQNAGEWGGRLSWHSFDGKDYYTIDYTSPQVEFPLDICQPNKFIEHNGRYYVLEGMAHLGDDYGSVMELTKVDGLWTGAIIVEFDSQPNDAVFNREGNMLVLTYKGIVQIKRNGHHDYLTRKQSWPWICEAYSMEINRDFIYLGMRGGVLRYTMTEPLRTAWITKK